VLALTCTRLSVRDPRSQFTTHPRPGSVPRPHRRPETTTDPTHDDVSRGRQTKSQVRNEPKSELPSLRKTKRRWHDLGRLGIKWGSHSTGYDRERVLQTRTGHLRHGTVVGRAEMISHSITHGFSFTLSSRLLYFVSWMTAEFLKETSAYFHLASSFGGLPLCGCSWRSGIFDVVFCTLNKL